MAKLYTSKKLATATMLPRKETVSFILQYSKVLKIVKSNSRSYHFIAN